MILTGHIPLKCLGQVIFYNLNHYNFLKALNHKIDQKGQQRHL